MTPRSISAIEALNGALARAEQIFRDGGFTTPASILITDDDRELVVGFKKSSGGWGIYFLRDGENEPELSLSGASLAERLAIAHSLPQLWEEIERAQDEQIQRIQAAVAAVKTFITAREK